jgi:hypothetical protein
VSLQPGSGIRQPATGIGQPEPGETPASLMPLDTPLDRRPYLLDWSRSNLENSFGLGYAAGQKFLADNAGKL